MDKIKLRAKFSIVLINSLLLNLLSTNKTVDDEVDRAVEDEHEVVDVGHGVHPLGVVRAQP
jgi:hypothetical protein